MVDKARPDSDSDSDENLTHSFLKKVLIAVAVAATITLLVLFIGYAANILLLVFVGILLGIVCRSLRDIFSGFTGLPSIPSLGIVMVILLVMIVGAGYLLAPRVYEQASMMYEQVPQEWNNIKQQTWQYEWGKRLPARIPMQKISWKMRVIAREKITI